MAWRAEKRDPAFQAAHNYFGEVDYANLPTWLTEARDEDCDDDAKYDCWFQTDPATFAVGVSSMKCTQREQDLVSALGAECAQETACA